MTAAIRVASGALRLTCAACLLLTISTATVPARLSAQCRLHVEAVDDASVAYRDRDNRCEGLYVGLQSAPLALQVVSLVKGGLDVDIADRVVTLAVPSAESLSTHGLAVDVDILGRAREANLNWALDARAADLEDRQLEWDLTVVREAGLEVDRLGLFGETRKEHGSPVYVPLDVQRDASAPGTIEFVFLLPAAADARLCTEYNACAIIARPHTTAAGYFDGYFVADLPRDQLEKAAAAGGGVATLTVRYRPHGRSWLEGGTDRVDIYPW